jgi:hypothetical protein
VQTIRSVGGRWSFEDRQRWLWRRGHGEMGPAVDIGKTRGDDIRIFYVSWMEREQLGCIGVFDIAEISEPERVDEVTMVRVRRNGQRQRG